MQDAQWIGVEYDAPVLRLWVMAEQDVLIRDQAQGPADDALAAMIAALPAPLRRLPVIRSGWPDAALTTLPAAPQIAGQSLSGLSQAAPAAIMRHQAGQIAGLLRAAPQFDGVVLCIGQHSLWAHVSAGEIVSCRASLTPDLLTHLGATAITPDEDFAAAVTQALSRPAAVAMDLASARAACDLQALSPTAMHRRMAGLLIGAELAAAKPYWLGQDVVLIARGDLAVAYHAALAAQGLTARRADAEAVTLAALSAAWQALRATAGSGPVN